MSELWRRLTGESPARAVILLLAMSGAFVCARVFRDLSLPAAGDGVAAGLIALGREMAAMGEKGVGGLVPAVAGLFLCLAVLAAVIHRELLTLFINRPEMSWRRRLARYSLVAVALVVFIYVVAQWLVVFLSFLLLFFALILLVSAFKGARAHRRARPH
ncbi:MAG: hypothetical protein IBX71_02300 [Candidatus Desulforudis sp.]|nr:hypothetical protein [Desulforudis sp.]